MELPSWQLFYCLFNIISPLMSIPVSIIGYRIYRATGQESSQS